MIATFVFLFFLFLTYSAYLLATSRSEARRAQLQQRLVEALQAEEDSQDAEVQLSRKDVFSGNPLLNRLLIRLRVAAHLNRMMSQADVHMTVTRLLLFCVLAGVAAMLTMYTLTNSVLVIVSCGLVAAVMPLFHLAWKRKKRFAKFLEHLPDALELISRALAVGRPFTDSLELVATQMPEPLSTEFRITYEEQKLGLSLKLALEHLAERVPLLDLRLCVTAILIQRDTGGNLAEILEKVSFTLRERFETIEELRTMTTGSRASAWILCGMPIVLALLLTAINPERMRVFWHDRRGQTMILIAVCMQIIGMLIIRKIVKFKM